MFPLPWNFPFRKKDGTVVNVEDAISGGGGSDLPDYDSSDAGKVLGVDENGNLEWSDEVNSEIQTLQNNVNVLIENGAVNKLPNTGTTGTKNGVTATYASDGKVTLNASSASTAISDFPISPTDKPFYLKAGTYKLSGGASADARLYIRTVESSSAIAIDSGNGAEFTVSDGNYAVYLNVASGKTFDNVVISPMIADADYTGGYVPYAMTNRELTEELNVEDLSSQVTLTENCFSCSLVRQSNICHINVAAKSGVNGFTSIATIPAALKPKNNTPMTWFAVAGADSSKISDGVLNTNGLISIRTTSATSDIAYLSCTWIV